jgi:E1A/CREB-binding protein
MNGTKRYYHPKLPENVKIKIDKAIDGDNPKGESSRSVQLLRYQLCEQCYARECGEAADGAAPIGLPIGITLKDLIAEQCPPIPRNDDPNPIMNSEFFDTRLQFLSLCQRNHYQFDSLRRARHSSMMVLYHLHNPGEPELLATCNICLLDVSPGQGYRCQQCPDFNLCCTCYEDPKVRHEHELKMILTKEDTQSRERALKETLDMLIHALFECNQPECDKPKCMGIKRLCKHASRCTTKLIGGCQYCKKIWAIFNAHSKVCAEFNCRVPWCNRLRDLRRQDAAHYEEMRRIAYRKMLEKQQALQDQTSESHS